MKSRRSAKSSQRSTVYSTDQGRMCPGCLRRQSECVCKTLHKTLQSNASADGIVRLHRDSKGRKGKGVTLIKGLAMSDDEMQALAKALKSSCGVGGSVKSGVIELQTADRAKIQALLEAKGHTVKIAGG